MRGSRILNIMSVSLSPTVIAVINREEHTLICTEYHGYAAVTPAYTRTNNCIIVVTGQAMVVAVAGLVAAVMEQ